MAPCSSNGRGVRNDVGGRIGACARVGAGRYSTLMVGDAVVADAIHAKEEDAAYLFRSEICHAAAADVTQICDAAAAGVVSGHNCSYMVG